MSLRRGTIAKAGYTTSTYNNCHVLHYACVRYDMFVPLELSKDAKSIMGQFHGRPDPRIFMNPKTGEVRRLSTSAAYAACVPSPSALSRCNLGSVVGGPYDGWRYKQGGYPPLTFSLDPRKEGNESWWGVVASFSHVHCHRVLLESSCPSLCCIALTAPNCPTYVARQ